MLLLSDNSRAVSFSTPSGEAGGYEDDFSGQDPDQRIINEANTVPLIKVFKFLGLHIDEQNKYSICPFKFHKGGRENSASFQYYVETNSFYCFGCNTGGKNAHACEFLAAYDQTQKLVAANKIINLFSDDIDPQATLNFDQNNFSERLDIMMDFSNTIREFRQIHTSEDAWNYVEQTCAQYDATYLKLELDNEALSRMVELLKEYLSNYLP
jgi:hypothetical protein